MSEITRHHDWAERDDADIWVAGGPTSGPIHVVEYDPRRPEQFDVVADRIRTALGDRVIELDHIGARFGGQTGDRRRSRRGRLRRGARVRTCIGGDGIPARDIYDRMFHAHGFHGTMMDRRPT